MKKFIVLFVILGIGLSAQAIDTTQTPFNFGGGLGFSSMHDTMWGSVELQPEFGFGPVGIGMKLNFRVSQYGNFRTEDWKSLEDWVGKIRYVRLGRKRSPFYARVGVLDRLTLGYGFIMDNYTNNIDENTRIVGLEFRSDLKKAGFDIVMSHLASPTKRIFGIRPYIRPVKFISNVPILSNLDVGLEFIRDGKIDPTHHIEFFGLDAGLPILNTSFISFGPYFSWANAIIYDGNGSGVGFRADINLIMNILHISAKLERRHLNGKFIPSYFNPLYEAKKVEYLGIIQQAPSSNGVFGELYGSAIGKIRLGGSYEYYPGVDSSGSIHLEADAPNFLRFGRGKIPILVMYDKCMLTSNDVVGAFTIDDRSLITTEISYEVLPHIYLTGIYERRFAKDPNTGEYKPLDKVGGKLEYRP